MSDNMIWKYMTLGIEFWISKVFDCVKMLLGFTGLPRIRNRLLFRLRCQFTDDNTFYFQYILVVRKLINAYLPFFQVPRKG